MELSRREFLKTTGAAVALTGVGITAASADTGASEAKKATHLVRRSRLGSSE